jgi:heme-degrading monooxygenase HmoA
LDEIERDIRTIRCSVGLLGHASRLPPQPEHSQEILKKFEERADKYRNVKGLLQEFYVQDKSTGHLAGVYVFDSKENLETFRNEALAKSIGEAYKFLEPPTTRVLDVVKVLFEKKEQLA